MIIFESVLFFLMVALIMLMMTKQRFLKKQNLSDLDQQRLNKGSKTLRLVWVLLIVFLLGCAVWFVWFCVAMSRMSSMGNWTS